jgi:hypothetical protein
MPSTFPLQSTRTYTHVYGYADADADADADDDFGEDGNDVLEVKLVGLCLRRVTPLPIPIYTYDIIVQRAQS